MGTRRVITGHQDGRSVVVDDSEVEGFSFGPYLLEPIWASPSVPPRIPYSGSIDFSGPWFPPPGAIRSYQATITPEADLDPDDVPDEAALAEVERRAPGALAHLEPDNPLMHTSQSVDIAIVHAGEVWLELDDGNEVLLRAGDHVVQNGTRHAWHNRSDEVCEVTFVIIGASRAGGPDR